MSADVAKPYSSAPRHDVHTVLELSVGLYLDPAAQVVHDERLLSLGQTYLDGHAGVFY